MGDNTLVTAVCGGILEAFNGLLQIMLIMMGIMRYISNPLNYHAPYFCICGIIDEQYTF